MTPSSTLEDIRTTPGAMPIHHPDAPEADHTDEGPPAVVPEPRKRRPSDYVPQDREISTEYRTEEVYKDAPPLVRLQRKLPGTNTEVLQQWEGHVTEIEGASVWASLTDLSGGVEGEEVVELPIEEFASDRDILSIGSVFYWTIGREWTRGGQMKRVSEIRLRRNPRLTERYLSQVRQKAEQLLNQLHSDVENPTAKG